MNNPEHRAHRSLPDDNLFVLQNESISRLPAASLSQITEKEIALTFRRLAPEQLRKTLCGILLLASETHTNPDREGNRLFGIIFQDEDPVKGAQTRLSGEEEAFRQRLKEALSFVIEDLATTPDFTFADLRFIHSFSGFCSPFFVPELGFAGDLLNKSNMDSLIELSGKLLAYADKNEHAAFSLITFTRTLMRKAETCSPEQPMEPELAQQLEQLTGSIMAQGYASDLGLLRYPIIEAAAQLAAAVRSPELLEDLLCLAQMICVEQEDLFRTGGQEQGVILDLSQDGAEDDEDFDPDFHETDHQLALESAYEAVLNAVIECNRSSSAERGVHDGSLSDFWGELLRSGNATARNHALVGLAYIDPRAAADNLLILLRQVIDVDADSIDYCSAGETILRMSEAPDAALHVARALKPLDLEVVHELFHSARFTFSHCSEYSSMRWAGAWMALEEAFQGIYGGSFLLPGEQ